MNFLWLEGILYKLARANVIGHQNGRWNREQNNRVYNLVANDVTVYILYVNVAA